jgi:tetratricopeptide (TPR) repeat protein
MKLSQTRLALLAFLVTLAVTASGCGVVNRIRAKSALNDGARAYRDGRFAEAQEKFQQARDLDPSQKNAPVFIARAIHAQYRPGVDTPENVKRAQDAIEAYKQVLANDPSNKDASNAIAYIYRQMRDEEKESAWLMQRATMQGAPAEVRSDAYTVLASKDWNCAYDITEANKKTVNKPDAVVIEYVKPKEQGDFDKARGCILKGLEQASKAIELNPSNPNAWSYKTNLIREQAKLAQMEGKADEKANFEREAAIAEAEARKLTEEAAAKKKEEDAKKAPKTD